MEKTKSKGRVRGPSSKKRDIFSGVSAIEFNASSTAALLILVIKPIVSAVAVAALLLLLPPRNVLANINVLMTPANSGMLMYFSNRGSTLVRLYSFFMNALSSARLRPAIRQRMNPMSGKDWMYEGAMLSMTLFSSPSISGRSNLVIASMHLKHVS